MSVAVCAGCKPGNATVKYETAPVARGALVQYVTASGTLNAVVSVDVGSQVSGKIIAINVDFNSPVKKGQLVAEIDPTVYSASLRQAIGQLASAKADATLKRQNLERKKVLVPLHAATQLDLDQATAELAQAEATVVVQQASMESAQANLDYCKITAPVDGIVISRKVDVGQTVIAAMSTPDLFTIAQDITKMNIKASVSEADIGQVKIGQTVDFTVDAFPDEVFHGTVSQVRKDPVHHRQRRHLRNHHRRREPGTKTLSRHDGRCPYSCGPTQGQALKIPNAALRYTPPEDAQFEQAPPAKMQRSQRLVYQTGTNGAKLKPVIIKAGITDGAETEILEGLAEGAPIVTATIATGASHSMAAGSAASAMSAPIIQLRDLAKTYHTGEVEVKAVRGVSLAIPRGAFVAVMGASGSGKSTLMNIVGCLDQPTEGNYWLDGVSVAELNRKQLAVLRNAKLGFVFQSFNLLARTSALENVELPMFYSKSLVSLRSRRKRAVQALEKVGLADRLHHHPSQLSGGQQQRIAIARALVNQPELVLADEPTGNLDTRTSIEIMGIFQELNRSGITIVMVTHELDIAAYCKRFVVMRDGRVMSDTENENPRDANEARAQLDQAEQKAQLA
jgi:RND family efflux transporter MFP subunit